MFCPKCGTNLADGSTFCSQCGANLNPQQPTPAAPKATPKSLLALVLAVACLLVMIIGHITLVNTSVGDMTLLKGAIGEDIEDMEDEMSDFAERYEDRLDDLDDELSKKDKALVKKLIKGIKACGKSFSIANVSNLMKTATSISDSDTAEDFNLEDDFDEIEEVSGIIDGIAIGLFIASMVCVIFSVLGGLLRKKGLVITGMILTTLFSLLIYGIVFVILTLAVHIILIKHLSDLKKAQSAPTATI